MKWRNNFFTLAVTCSCLFLARNADAQLSGDDSDFYKSALAATIKLYHQANGDQSALYNGMLYPGYPFQFKGEGPFFNSGRPDTGSVYYDNILYTDLPLYFDCFSDVLIIDDNGYKIELDNKRFDEFFIGGHHFIRPREKEKNNNDLIAGFYEVLYSGRTSVLKKTIKKIVDDFSDNEIVEKRMTSSDHFYIDKDSVVYPAENINDIKAVFNDEKTEILRFVRKNKLGFRKDIEHSLLKITAYYDQVRK